VPSFDEDQARDRQGENDENQDMLNQDRGIRKASSQQCTEHQRHQDKPAQVPPDGPDQREEQVPPEAGRKGNDRHRRRDGRHEDEPLPQQVLLDQPGGQKDDDVAENEVIQEYARQGGRDQFPGPAKQVVGDAQQRHGEHDGQGRKDQRPDPLRRPRDGQPETDRESENDVPVCQERSKTRNGAPPHVRGTSSPRPLPRAGEEPDPPPEREC
jgi:hypothetical protein